MLRAVIVQFGGLDETCFRDLSGKMIISEKMNS
uniref:Uncharacterized protein n=1 Tax=Anguilla anguilla TaxID=7936 RepID=A0A0E9VGQ6_ANGAN